MELTITTSEAESFADDELRMHNCLHDSVDRLEDRLEELASRLDTLVDSTGGIAANLGKAQARLRKLDEDQREQADMLVEVLQQFDLPT